MQQMAKVESALLPGITMKGFDLGEKEKALAWLK